jgi:hypothetical protein
MNLPYLVTFGSLKSGNRLEPILVIHLQPKVLVQTFLLWVSLRNGEN